MREMQSIESILMDIRKALLAGELDRIDGLTRAQDLAMAALHPAVGRDRLRAIHSAAQRNAILIRAARDGVLNARRSVQSQMPLAAPIRTYGPEGHARSLQRPPPAIHRQS